MQQQNSDRLGYQVIVTGLVQGVGFRYFTAKEANRLSISGYAKNLADGTVEVQMFGSQSHLAVLLQWLKKGPKTSVVSELDITEILYIDNDRFSCL